MVQKTLIKYLAIGLGVIMILGAWAGSYVFVYELGKAKQQEVCTQEKLDALAEQQEALERDAADRVAKATEAGKRQAKLEQGLARGKEKLDEAIDNAGPRPECNLTPDELRGFQEIIDA